MPLFRTLGGLTIAALMLFAACQSEKIDNTLPVEPGRPVSFSQDVQPIFNNSCGGAACHIDQQTNGVRLSSYEEVMNSTGDQYGEAIVQPGSADESPLVDKIEPNPRFGVRMPQGQAPLSGEEIALIRAWIDDGAQDN